MKISDLSSVTGIDIQTIRYYEKEGLLPTIERLKNGYREFSQTHLKRLEFIRRCRSLNMSLSEIRVLLGFIDSPQQPCQSVNQLLETKITQVQQQMKTLKQLESQLQSLKQSCSDNQLASDCGILWELSTKT